jgi:hypothetical protein
VARVRAPTTGWLVSHLARLFTPCPDPRGAGSLIRDLSGEGDRTPKRQRVHVDAAYHIPMTNKPTDGVAAAPDPSFDFLFPAAYRTLAARSPLRTSEAHDAGCLGFTRQVGDIPAVLPPGQALIVMPSTGALAHAMRITDEQSARLMLLTKGDDFSGALVA